MDERVIGPVEEIDKECGHALGQNQRQSDHNLALACSSVAERTVEFAARQKTDPLHSPELLAEAGKVD